MPTKIYRGNGKAVKLSWTTPLEDRTGIVSDDFGKGRIQMIVYSKVPRNKNTPLSTLPPEELVTMQWSQEDFDYLQQYAERITGQ